ncbi:histidine kinase [Halobacteriales archaeon QS_5_70_17]|nr:MAG: histidine kinase [Halobacteriales archaeon QS_5_70_17]
MSQQTATSTPTATERGAWKGAVVAGAAGAIVMGALMSVMNPDVLAVAPNGVAGWVVHVSHGAVLGVVFAAGAGAAGIDRSVGRSAVAGVVYGAVIWIALAALLMPLWLSAVGSPASPPFPNFAVPSLLWHVVYGVVLGALYPPLRGL